MKRLNIGPCTEGYEYVKTDTGYVCKGGGHSVTFEQLGNAKVGFFFCCPLDFD